MPLPFSALVLKNVFSIKIQIWIWATEVAIIYHVDLVISFIIVLGIYRSGLGLDLLLCINFKSIKESVNWKGAHSLILLSGYCIMFYALVLSVTVYSFDLKFHLLPHAHIQTSVIVCWGA